MGKKVIESPDRKTQVLTTSAPDSFLSSFPMLLWGTDDDPRWTALDSLGSYAEHDILRVLDLAQIKPGLIVDVGAGTGDYALFFARTLGREVVALEPHPNRHRLLLKTLKDNMISDRVSAPQVGASKGMQWAKIFSKSVTGVGASLDARSVPDIFEEKAVRLVALDSIDLGDRPIGLISVRTNGHEATILKGACNIIKKNRPYVAVSVPDQINLQEIQSILEPYNYALLGLFGQSRTGIWVNGEDYLTAANLVKEDRLYRARQRFLENGSVGNLYKSEYILAEIDRVQTAANLTYQRLYDSRKKIDRIEAELKVEREKVRLERLVVQEIFKRYGRIYEACAGQPAQKVAPSPENLSTKLGQFREKEYGKMALAKAVDKDVKNFSYITYTRPEDRKVRVGIAAIPNRLSALRRTLDSLLPQVDEIFVSLNGFDAIPEDFNHPKLTMVLSENVGDLAKFSFLDDDFDGYYFTCDDDIEFANYHVDSIIYYLEKYEGKIVAGWHGSILKEPFENYYDSRSRRVLSFGSAQHSGQFVDFLGTGCIGFDTRIVRPPQSIFKRPNMADIYLSLWLKQNRFYRYLVPHNRGESRDLGFLYEGTSISGEGIADSDSRLNTRAEVNRLVSRETDWTETRIPPKTKSKIAIIGRFDHARWNKGGIYKSCHLMAAQLRQTGYQAEIIEITSPISEILTVLADTDAKLCIVYGGDSRAQDALNIDLLLQSLDKIPCPTFFNLSYNTSEARNREISAMTQSFRPNDGVFAFTQEASKALEQVVTAGRTATFPKTILLSTDIPEREKLSRFEETSGIFMGDCGKFLDPVITPDFEEILAHLFEVYNRSDLVFVRQYNTPKIAEYLKGCTILPHGDVYDEISRCRVYLHTQKITTFEMLPIEMMSRGSPIVYPDMPQSLNTYIGSNGKQFTTHNEMMSHVDVLMTDPILWRTLRNLSIISAQYVSYDQTASALADEVERLIVQ
jgi:FkbM family methyltransferase